MPESTPQATNHYRLLGLEPGASVQAIRRAYRDLSKLYHPDTTTLPDAIATDKFQQLNEAYATLSNPERRLAYDHKIGYSRIAVMQSRLNLNQPVSRQNNSRDSRDRSAYLDPTDRPLSAGELFAIFILGVTFVACLVLVIAIGITQGEVAFGPLVPPDLTVESPLEPATELEPAFDRAPADRAIDAPSPPKLSPETSTLPPRSEERHYRSTDNLATNNVDGDITVSPSPARSPLPLSPAPPLSAANAPNNLEPHPAGLIPSATADTLESTESAPQGTADHPTSQPEGGPQTLPSKPQVNDDPDTLEI